MYPSSLKEFFTILANRSLFTKTYSNPIKFKASRIKYKEHFDAFDVLTFPVELSVADKIKWIQHDLTAPPTCKQCHAPTKPNLNSGEYPEFCNQRCYSDYMREHNNYAKRVIINGVIYDSSAIAVKHENISYYLLKQMLYSDEYPDYKYYPDHERQMKLEANSLQLAHPLLLDKDWLNDKKESRITMNEISEELNVSLNVLRLAYYYHNIKTEFDQIPVASKLLLSDKMWLTNKINEADVISLSKELECSTSTIHKKCQQYDIELPARASSAGEEELAKFIMSLGFDIIQRTRKIIKPLELDIFIPSVNLGIEYNGVYYHREKEDKHFKKYKKCKDVGVQLIQVFEDDWTNNKELVKKKISHILGVTTAKSVYARNCVIKNITSSEAKNFYVDNHIYGDKKCNKHYGLIFDGELIASMSFKSNKLERYATSTSVVGGFSKLLKYSIQQNDFKTIETFSDLCWSDHESNVYLTNGFTLVSITQPNYFWVVNGKRESRLKYQKHKLTNMASYDVAKSEKQIMEEMGYYRIFDAGHAKLIKVI